MIDSWAFKEVKKDVKYVKVDHYDRDERCYKVYYKGKLIGEVSSWTRTSTDIPNSNFSRDIKGVKEWGGRTADNVTIGMYHKSRNAAAAHLF